MAELRFESFENSAGAQRVIDLVLPAGTAQKVVEEAMLAAGAEVHPQDGGLLFIWEGPVAELVRKRWLVSMAFDERGRLVKYGLNHGLIAP